MQAAPPLPPYRATRRLRRFRRAADSLHRAWIWIEPLLTMTRTPGVRESPVPFGGGLVESRDTKVENSAFHELCSKVMAIRVD